MKRNQVWIICAAAAISFIKGSVPPAWAASGTWSPAGFSGNGTGNWDATTTTNWLGGIIADGARNTADFSTLNITANSTVSLITNHTIGVLKFQDAVTSSNTWTLDNGGGSSILTLDNGASQPVIDVLNQSLTLSAPLAGTNGFQKIDTGVLILSGTNSGLSGTITQSRGDTQVSSNTAFGTGTVVINPGSNNTRILLNSGVNLANNLTITTSNSGAGTTGSIQTNGAFSASVSGNITINGVASSGGTFAGPSGANFLSFTGSITDTLAPNFVSGGSGNGVVVRSGNVLLSGGGSYFRIDERGGTMAIGANNGVATNAFVNLGGNGNSILDLAGFNQSLVSVTNLIGSPTNVITNSSTTSASTLTLTPNPSSYSILQFTNLTYSGTITDAAANAPLNIVINSSANPNAGDSTGIQTFSNAGSTYDGTTTISSGTLAVASLSNGGSASSIGKSSNAAANLVLDGGKLQYTGATTSTDRSFTITAGKTGTINVSNAAAILTMSGGSAATTGSFIKAGAGTLAFTGANLHTGATTVAAGTLLVDGSLSSSSAVSVTSGAILGGIGTVGGLVTPAAGGIIAPGDAGVGTLMVGALTLNTGAFLNYEFGTGNDQITVSNSGGLTVNGASLNLYNSGGTTTFSTDGTYTLMNISGGLTGSVSNISISNPAAGKVYGLVSTPSSVQLTIGDATTIEWNDNAGTNLWSTPGNWIGGVVPNGLGQTAKFGTNIVGSNGAVTLTSPETVSGLIFNNGSVSYNLTGSGSLILNNGVAAAAVDVLNGVHSINVPIAIAGATAFDTTNTTDLMTVTGNITGAKPITVNGPGTLDLTGTNGFTTVTVNGGTLNVGIGTTGSLGSGAVTLTGGAVLNFNTSTTNNFGQSITGSGSVSQLGSGTTSVGAISGVSTVNSSSGTLVVAGGIAQSSGVNVTGTGSLTVSSGGVSGAGPLIVNTTGNAVLTGSNTYTGGTTLTAGTLALGAASTFPASSLLEVDGGTFDLHGNNISLSNITDLANSTGMITNNGPAGSTSTIAFGGFQANYNIYAALNDGTGNLALTSNIANTGSGALYFLHLHTAGTYSGGTTISAQSIEVDATNALGVGPVTILQNNSSINNSMLLLAGGVTIPNNITIVQGNPGVGAGAVNYLSTSTGSSTLTGSVTVQSDGLSGGTFVGPTTAGDMLNVNGPVFATGTATYISIRAGNVGLGGGGSYPLLNVTGTAFVNALNGIAPGAVVDLATGILDLNGNNQTIAGLAVTGGTGLATNSSATPGILTINSAVADNYSGTITGNAAFVDAGVGAVTLAGSNTYSNGTTVNPGASVIVAGSLPTTGAVISNGNLTFTANNGTTVQTVPIGPLSIGTTSASGLVTLPINTVTAGNSNRTLLQTPGLTFGGTTNAWIGKLDLGNSEVDVQGVAAAGFALINNQVKEGFAAGTWSGPAGIVSTAASGDLTHLTAVGAILNNTDGSTALLSMFDGVAVGASDVLVKYTYYGDANLDGGVDGSDYTLIDNGFNQKLTGWYNGDFNYDGKIDGSDYTLIDNAFNTQGTSLGTNPAVLFASSTDQIGGSSAVPEPATLSMLGLGAVGLLARRRRHA